MYAVGVYVAIMTPGLHVVAELPQFLRDVEAAKIGEAQHQAIIDVIAANPRQGDEVRASGGVRKVRFAGRGKEKAEAIE